MLFLLFPARCISHAALHVGGWRVLSAFLRGRGSIWVVAAQVHRLKQNYPPNSSKTTQEHSVMCWMSDMRSCLCRPWGNTGAVRQRFMCKNCVPRELNPNAVLDEGVSIWHRFLINSSLSLPSLVSLWIRYGTCFKIPVLILEESGKCVSELPKAKF